MKPNHKCDPARMALLYIRQQFICTTFKFDAYIKKRWTSVVYCMASDSGILKSRKSTVIVSQIPVK